MTYCPKCWSRDTGHSFVRGSSKCKECGNEWNKTHSSEQSQETNGTETEVKE